MAVLWTNALDSVRYWQAADAAARKRGWKLLKLEIRDAGELEGAFKTATECSRGRSPHDARPRIFFGRARQVAELAATNRLPAMYELRQYVEAGGLIFYGADVDEIWRRAATFVDKILKGARPAELPGRAAHEVRAGDQP